MTALLLAALVAGVSPEFTVSPRTERAQVFLDEPLDPTVIGSGHNVRGSVTFEVTPLPGGGLDIRDTWFAKRTVKVRHPLGGSDKRRGRVRATRWCRLDAAGRVLWFEGEATVDGEPLWSITFDEPSRSITISDRSRMYAAAPDILPISYEPDEQPVAVTVPVTDGMVPGPAFDLRLFGGRLDMPNATAEITVLGDYTGLPDTMPRLRTVTVQRRRTDRDLLRRKARKLVVDRGQDATDVFRFTPDRGLESVELRSGRVDAVVRTTRPAGDAIAEVATGTAGVAVEATAGTVEVAATIVTGVAVTTVAVGAIVGLAMLENMAAADDDDR